MKVLIPEKSCNEVFVLCYFPSLLGCLLTGQLVSSSEAAWYAMSPKLRCGGDIMKLQLSGPEVAQIELCRGNL